MSNWLEEMREQQERTEYQLQSLYRIYNALCIVGNKELSRKLCDIADEIAICNKNTKDIVSAHIDELFKQSQEASANVAKAALAGVKLSKEGD